MNDPMDRTEPNPLDAADRRDKVPDGGPPQREGLKGRDMNAARHPSNFEEQRPVAWAGWLLALFAGAAIWALIFRLWLA